MKNLRDIVPVGDAPLEGEKVTMDSILNLRLNFTDWSIRKSSIEKDAEYVILQFEKDGKLHVVMTGSRRLISDVRKYEESAGKEPFAATVVKKGKAYVFA